MTSTCHIVGAGLAGLSAAVRLQTAGRKVVVYEGAAQAGGRCRSFFDSRLQKTIDNGNHLVLSGNRAALDYLDLIGTRGQLSGPKEPVFPFVDLKSGERWAVRPNLGPVPWWVLMRERRIPGTGLMDYIAGSKLALAGPDRSVADIIPGEGLMAERFWDPFTIAVMNAPPNESSARLLWSVIRETFVRGGEYCIPLFTENGLGPAFIEPAIDTIQSAGGSVTLNKRLLELKRDGDRVTGLVFRDGEVPVLPDDRVVLAISPAQLATLMPELNVPEQTGIIVNAHFVLEHPLSPVPEPPFIGVLNSATQWIFVRDDVVSITISAAGALGLDGQSEEAFLPTLWNEVGKALNIDSETGFAAGRIVKEKRATFDQSPSAAQRRPNTQTDFTNLVLAGDVVNTGLPATIEGAIRSGELAAESTLRVRDTGP